MGSTSTNDKVFMSMKEVNVGCYQFKMNFGALPLEKNRWRSSVFSVGGHAWCLFYASSDHLVDVIVPGLLSKADNVRATFDLSLLTKDGEPSSDEFKRISRTFSPSVCAGLPLFCVRREVLVRDYVVDGCFVIHCTVFVSDESIREPRKRPIRLQNDLGDFLKDEDTADITIKVDGEIFHAHKQILAARSPVFKAELYGSMVEKESNCIEIEDMKYVVFECLLSYMYTDTFEGKDPHVVQHLLVAADRYGLDGLKMKCEQMLCKSISLDTVTSCLALAEQHKCDRLKDDSLDFAVQLENFLPLTLTDGYLQLMQDCPSIFSELRERANSSIAFQEAARSKKRRIR